MDLAEARRRMKAKRNATRNPNGWRTNKYELGRVRIRAKANLAWQEIRDFLEAGNSVADACKHFDRSEVAMRGLIYRRTGSKLTYA
ncbi:MAG: hypothetical protein VX309_06475 [Pseudomonadota bacterium]|nr:hypothetical protein [Pseudomonadota bacterium]